MNEAIVVNHISKSYGKKVSSPLSRQRGGGGESVGSVAALSDVSFSVGKGEVFGLIGPDGAGKTTMFRILCTLLLADEGTATVDGFDVVRQMKDIRKRVGYMPGRFSLYQDLTVEENLQFFATLRLHQGHLLADRTVQGPQGRCALWRHETEAGTLVCPHSSAKCSLPR